MEVAMLEKLSCLVGRHAWVEQVNRDVAGKDAVYSVCSRCGKERAGYGPPTAGGATGIGGLGG
jgi:hypothetical protein